MKYIFLPLAGIIAISLIVLVGLGLSVKLPGEYETPSGLTRYSSRYLPMRDGVEIAVDVWLPKDYQTGQKLPTVMHATRYGRAFKVGFPAKIMMSLGKARPINYSSSIHNYNENGYVIVRVDARGSGASFGQRTHDLSTDELEDYGQVIDWIADQSWSNGKVGAAGVSYPGMTSEMMTAANRSALKAVAPYFTYFDVFQMLSHPGGVFNQHFVSDWSDLTQSMDENRCFIPASKFDCWVFMKMVEGIRPVDGPDAEKKHKRAYTGRDNPTVMENLESVKFRDDPFGPSGTFTASPHIKMPETANSGVAMSVWTGWYDSATSDGAIARFKTLSNKQEVRIGALSHGGRHDTNSFAPVKAKATPTQSEQREQLMAFFDKHLKGDVPESERTHELTYYTLGENKYHTTNVWPPVGIENKRWSLGASGTLTNKPSAYTTVQTSDTYAVDFSTTTGPKARWHSIGGPDIIYPDRREEDKKLLTYTSEPLTQDLEISGAPQISLNLASTHKDGALHVYLEAVSVDGRVTYITEGILSLKNRAISDETPYEIDTVYHSLERADAMPLTPGEAEDVVVPLFNISVLLRKGDRIRVAVAGADKDTFARVPEAGNPVLTINHGNTGLSFIDLPQRWR
ncbi:MAG: CocE/NonD family hydrolase [Kordiimonadaceae bacterium]|nr:CocE/NonD family hydrolase [Kordiimonadaceae bacterium]